MSEDICGSTDTSSGDPCKFSPGESCPWHNDDKDPDTRSTELEENPEIVDLVAGCLNNGDTIAEACAEAQISEDQYYNWRRRGIDGEGIFGKFYEETAQARKTASKRDRQELRAFCKQTNDARTWFKLHMNQYGDTYGDEETDMRERDSITVESDVVTVTEDDIQH